MSTGFVPFPIRNVKPFVAVVRAAIESIGTDDSAEHARLLGLLAVELTWAEGDAGERLTLISDGGIASADDVAERLAAGATLVQLYTALIYEGPGLPSRLNRELAATR